MDWRNRCLSRALWVVLACGLFLFLASCGGGSSSSSSTSTTVTKITLTPATANVAVGQTQAFYAAPVDANNNAVSTVITWTSSTPAVATIDSNGVATGLTAGTTQITATAGGVTSNSATLTVTQKVASVSITPLSGSVKVGNTIQFSATPLDTGGNPIAGVTVSWYCSFSGVATIDTNGLVTGVAPGTVTIVASVGNITSQPAVLTVTP
jgi:uncharacterized protein YjdB